MSVAHHYLVVEGARLSRWKCRIKHDAVKPEARRPVQHGQRPNQFFGESQRKIHPPIGHWCQDKSGHERGGQESCLFHRESEQPDYIFTSRMLAPAMQNAMIIGKWIVRSLSCVVFIVEPLRRILDATEFNPDTQKNQREE